MADPESSTPPPEREPALLPRRGPLLERLLIPFASLENRTFRLLWLGQLGQASAMWADQVGRSWLTWQLTGSATAVGLVNLFRAIPFITLGRVDGLRGNRWHLRRHRRTDPSACRRSDDCGESPNLVPTATPMCCAPGGRPAPWAARSFPCYHSGTCRWASW